MGEIVFHNWHIAKQITECNKRRDPAKSANHVIGQEVFIIHAACTRHEGRKGTRKRHKTRKNNGFSAVSLKKLLGFDQMFFIDKT